MHGFVDLITLTYINGDKLSLEKKKKKKNSDIYFCRGKKKKGGTNFWIGYLLNYKDEPKGLM